MSFMIPILDHPAVETIGWSLVHFVWQGLAIAALLAGVLSALGRTSSHTRYLVECGALVFMAICPLCTCFWLTANYGNVTAANHVLLQSGPAIALRQAKPAEIVSEAGQRALHALPEGTIATEVASSVEPLQAEPLAAARTVSGTALTRIARFQQTVQAWLPWLVLTWMLGVLGLSARLVTGWYLVQRIRRLATVPSVETWIERCRQLADRLGIRRSVKLVESALIEVPSVIGWLRPTILLPVSALTGLESSQLEAILVHELAHIRRHDYLVNLAQIVMETLLFYHPAVWWVSRLIRDEREHCCDDLAVEVCGNRIAYARALAEMESLRTGPRLTVAVTDGSLMSRVRRLVVPDSAAQKSRSWAGSPIAIAIVGGLLAALYMSLPAQADAPTQPEDNKTQVVVTGDGQSADQPPRSQVEQILKPLITRAEASRQSIKTAHVKFRIFNGPGPFKLGMTPARCTDLLSKYDLVKNPDELRKLVLELFEDGEMTADPPWTESELYMDGFKFREERLRPQGEPDVQITDEKLSLNWNAGNSQVDIQPIALGFRHRHTLDDFRQPAFQVGGEPKITHRKGQLFVTSADAKTGWSTDLVVDETTGFQLQRTFRQRDLAAKNGDSSKDSYWLGWQAGADGIPFPKLVVDFHFVKGQLQYSSFMIVREVAFNKSLSGSLFQLCAPAGSVIVDHREGGMGWGRKINYDVLDVTSEEQVSQAIRNLTKEPATPEEKFALAELSRLYSLADDETLKRIGPPFPLSRKYIHWMVRRNDVPARRSVHFDLIAWKGNSVEDTFSFEGITPTLQQLIFQFLKFDSTTIEGHRAILQRELAGDYVYRRDAAPERLADRLAQIASDEFGIPLTLSIRDVERPTLIVRGKLKLREGVASVALNGGPHTGDYGEKLNGGQVAYFLQEVGRYIGTPVIDETGIVNQPLVWSERWYDLKTTKPEKRFQLDPAFVLKQITEQTGLTFTKETRKVRMLFVDAGDDPRPVTPQAQAPKKPLTDAEIQVIQRLIDRQVDADAMVSIKGQVHDEAGQPVAGADLVLPLLYDKIGQTINGKSDASGRFELQAPKKLLDMSAIHSSATLWCMAPGKQVAAFRLFNQPLEKVAFKLETAGEVPFQVIDTAGKPVSGAIVEPRLFVIERHIDGQSTTYYGGPVPSEFRALLKATTDSEGRGRLAGIAARDIMSVHIQHEEFGTQWLPPKRNEGDPTIRWELQFPGRISGQVKCDVPEALKGLKLKLQCKNTDLRNNQYHLEDVEVPVDASGRFEFVHVFSDWYQIVSAVPLNGEWMLRYADRFWVTPKGMAQVEMQLERAVPVTGLVKDRETGLPVPDVTVHLESMEGSGWASVKTDDTGRYRSRTLSGRVKVRANPMNSEKWFNDDFRNGKYTERIWSVKPGSEPVEMPVLDVISTIAVKGQLIGEDLRPLEYVAIDALDADGNSVSLGGAYTQRYGVFQIRVRESAKIASYQLGRKGRENFQTHALSVENQAPLVLRSLTHKKQP